MATEETELAFIRCPGCRSLVPSVATRCRMCGEPLKDQAADDSAEAGRKSRVRQRTMSVSANEVEAVKEELTPRPSEPDPSATDTWFASTPPAEPSYPPEPLKSDPPPWSEPVRAEVIREEPPRSEPQPLPRAEPASPVRSEPPRPEPRFEPPPPRPEPARESPPWRAEGPYGGTSPTEEDLEDGEDYGDEEFVDDEGEGVEEAPPSGGLQPGERKRRRRRRRRRKKTELASPAEERMDQYGGDQARDQTREYGNTEHRARQPEAPGRAPAPIEEGHLLGWLVTYDHGGKGTAREIRSGRFFIGGAQLRDGDYVIVHPSVSTPHCMVNATPGEGLRIMDLMSERGTFVKRRGTNGFAPQTDQVTLGHGDWVRFGSFEVLVCLVPV